MYTIFYDEFGMLSMATHHRNSAGQGKKKVQVNKPNILRRILLHSKGVKKKCNSLVRYNSKVRQVMF